MDGYRRDATFRAQPGSTGVPLASLNDHDNPTSYPADVSWAITTPWTP